MRKISPDKCNFSAEIYLSYPVLRNNIFPVAKTSVEVKGNEINKSYDDSISIIKKIWELDEKVALDHVYVDISTLKKNFSGLESLEPQKSVDDFSFRNFRNYKKMFETQSKWSEGKEKTFEIVDDKVTVKNEDKIEKIIKDNGGWIIDEGRKELHGSCAVGLDSGDTRDACMLVTLLQNLQDRKGYHFKTRTTVRKNTKKGETITDRANVMDIRKLAMGGTKNPNEYAGFKYKIPTRAILNRLKLFNIKPTSSGKMKPYDAHTGVFDSGKDQRFLQKSFMEASSGSRFYTMLDIPILLWVKKDMEKIDQGVKMYNSMINDLAVDGIEPYFDDLETMKRWGRNIIIPETDIDPLNMMDFVKEVPSNIKNKDVFVKSDFLEKEDKKGNKQSFSSSCVKGSGVVLIDHEGNFVKFQKKLSSGRIVPKRVGDVIGKEDPSDLKKWKWICVSAKPNKDFTYVPKKFMIRRAVDVFRRDDDKFDETVDSFDDALKDVGSSIWNAMVSSSLKKVSDFEKEDVDKWMNDMIKNFEKVSGKENFDVFSDLVLSGSKIMMKKGKNFFTTPYIMRRKNIGMKRQGVPQKMAGEIIVGIETDLRKTSKSCQSE